MLDLVKKLAERFGVSLKTEQCYSHQLPFADNYFDIVYAANLFHHVDLKKSLFEVKRVLKPGGLLVSWDPLIHNPLINVYRRMAMGVRTEDEHPLAMKDLKVFKSQFIEVDYQMTWFFTLWIFLKFYFIDRINPNQDRYWKKILTDHKKLEKIYLFLEKIDNWVLRILPFLRRYCWNITIFAKK